MHLQRKLIHSLGEKCAHIPQPMTSQSQSILFSSKQTRHIFSDDAFVTSCGEHDIRADILSREFNLRYARLFFFRTHDAVISLKRLCSCDAPSRISALATFLFSPLRFLFLIAFVQIRGKDDRVSLHNASLFSDRQRTWRQGRRTEH